MQIREKLESILSLESSLQPSHQLKIGQAYLEALCLKIELIHLLGGKEERNEKAMRLEIVQRIKQVLCQINDKDLRVLMARLHMDFGNQTNTSIINWIEQEVSNQEIIEEFSNFSVTLSSKEPEDEPVEPSLPFQLDISNIQCQDKETRPQKEDFSKTSLSATSISSQIESYLARIAVYRSEINLLSQFMKLPSIKYYRFKHVDRYYVQASFQLSCSFTGYQRYEFYGQGWSTLYKHACDQAAYQVLHQVYHHLPNLWKQFLALKARKGLA